MKVLVLLAWMIVGGYSGMPVAQAQQIDGGQQFTANCSGCHGLDGRGTARGADIATQPNVSALSDAELAKIIHDGVPGKSMPPMAALGDDRIAALVSYIRTLQGKDGRSSTPPVREKPRTDGAPGEAGGANSPEHASTPPVREKPHTDGAPGDVTTMLSAINVQPADLAQKALAENWTSYNGDYSGRRYSSLDQIAAGNASRVKLAWRLHTQNAGMMEATPVVVNGVMYVTRSMSYAVAGKQYIAVTAGEDVVAFALP